MRVASLDPLSQSDESRQGTGQLVKTAGVGQGQLQLRAALIVVANQRLQSAADFAHNRCRSDLPRRWE